jgi:hypothetical protein
VRASMYGSSASFGYGSSGSLNGPAGAALAAAPRVSTGKAAVAQPAATITPRFKASRRVIIEFVCLFTAGSAP